MLYHKRFLETNVFGDFDDPAERISQLKALDSTSAPGNKSLQLSEIVSEVMSFEKDEQRFSVLKKRIHEWRARNVTVVNADFLDADPVNNEVLQEIDIILCDPSCSGSGMKLHSGP